MSIQRRRGLHGDLRTTHTKKQPTADKYPTRRFPIQHEIRQLEDELNSFNERIAELEDEGHRGHAMEVLCATDRRASLLITSVRSERYA